jgi:hypothetical protein
MKIVFDHLDKFKGWRIDQRSGDERDNVALLKSLVVQQGGCRLSRRVRRGRPRRACRYWGLSGSG